MPLLSLFYTKLLKITNFFYNIKCKSLSKGLVQQYFTPIHATRRKATHKLNGFNWLYFPINQMLPSQVLKVPQYPKTKADGPECGQDFCTLGCICSSLQYPNRGSLHCRRPECMFGCACFKRRITKQLTAGESEQLVQPVYCKICY